MDLLTLYLISPQRFVPSNHVVEGRPQTAGKEDWKMFKNIHSENNCAIVLPLSTWFYHCAQRGKVGLMPLCVPESFKYNTFTQSPT